MEIKAETTNVRSVCPYCGVGCGVILETQKGKVRSVKGDNEHPANFGKLCTKGTNLHKTIHTPDRLTQPMMRKTRSDSFLPVSWDTALDSISQRFSSYIKDYGTDSVAFYVSGQLMNEDYYVVAKLAKGFLKTNNQDSNSRLCMSSAVAGYRRAFGVDAPPCSYEDLDIADCIFIIGSNTAYCHPVLFTRIAEAKSRKGDKLKIIVADPRKTPTAGIADIYIPLNPGTDVALVNGMIRVLIKEGLIDRDYISKHTEGFEQLEKTVEDYTLEKVAETCCLPPLLVHEAALVYAKATASLTLWAMGLNQSRQGTDKNNAVINLSLATGNIGRPGAGPFSLTGQSNAMGGRESGGLANLLPGHRYMESAEHRSEVAAFWGCGEMSAKKGLTAVELFDAVHKGVIKAVWIICTNPVVSIPNGGKLEEALNRAELVVVQDLFKPTDTGLFADILLPAAGFGEKEGTMTNSERRISYLGKAVEPPGDGLPDWEIMTRFAHKMGFAEFFPYTKAEDIFGEYKKLTRGTDMDITGINYDRLQKEGPIQWPCADDGTNGTARLYTDGKFHTESGKARFIATEFISPAETADKEYPLVLTTGRLRDQWHTMTKTGKVESLRLKDPSPVLEVNPKDASNLSLKEGDLVVAESRRGQATVRITVTENVKEGTVFLPFHWGKILADNGRANLMTIEALDPFSKQPEFKACAVRVRKKAFDERMKVVVVGNDPAGLTFLETLTEINPNAEVILFSSEYPASLPKGVLHHRDLPARIDVEKSLIFFSDGSIVPYEKLVLATGSRYYIPPISDLSRRGVLILESLEQAKKALSKLHLVRRAIVVGESPLSLAACEYLRARGSEVEFVDPSKMLLEKQLDAVASEMLFYRMKSRGISIKLGAPVDSISGNGRATGIRLESGDMSEGDLVAIEARLMPNIDLAFKGGIVVNKGIVVGDRMETSAPNVYAVGGAAEHRGVISDDAEIASEQARFLGRYLAGDPTVRYQGDLSCSRFRALGFYVTSFGEFNADDEESNVLSYLDRAQSVYKKIVVRENRIVGGLFFGDTSSAEEILQLARMRADISAMRKNLLSGNFKGQAPKGKILCSCIGVTIEEIEAAIKQGATTVEWLQENLRVGTNCGTCLTEVRGMIKSASVN